MNKLVSIAVIAALVTGCVTPPRPDTASAGGPPGPQTAPVTADAPEPDSGAAIAAELGFHGPRERTDLTIED